MAYNVTTFFQYHRRYLERFFLKEVGGWFKIIRFLGVIGVVALAALTALMIYVDPLPPGTAYLATGQEGSSYRHISEAFQKTFQSNGIHLKLVPTAGLGEGLKGLDSDASEVSAGFLTAGIVSAKQHPELISLGSIQYAPLWFFYKGDTVITDDPFEYFSNKKVAIGPAKNATNNIYRMLYALNQHTPPNAAHLVELPNKEAAEQLIAGNIDAAFIVDNYESETVQALLKGKDIKIMNFALADAYLKLLPFLQKLVVPKGSVNLESVYPPEDTTILATTTTLLVEKRTHAAIQWAYLIAVKEIASRSDTFFAKAGSFPKNIEQSFPLSPVAKRFYEQGVPDVFSYFPLWLASVIDRIWMYVLSLFIVVFSGYKVLTAVRLFPSEFLMNNMFLSLRELDEAVVQAATKEQVQDIADALRVFEKEIYENWLVEKNSRFYFNLKNALSSVRRDAQEKLNALNG
jgi:TRAP-type uncharacterized transport system substrate-binding protein